MPSVLNTKPSRATLPPLIRAVFRPWAILLLLVLAPGGTRPLEAANQRRTEPIHKFRLTADLSGQIDSEGGLIILPAGSSTLLLEAEPVSLTDSRRRRGADTFSAVAVDGLAGGHRGFSARADDDQDGLIDEDPLDGIDNDRDGAVDEDYAAISDAMVAVHLDGLHLEYYHWATPRLSTAIFLNPGEGLETYRIHSSGPAWQEADIDYLRHTVAGRLEKKSAVAVVCRVGLGDRPLDGEPCAPGSGLWLGVIYLAENASSRFVMEEDRLDLILGDDNDPVAICVAESWLQLNRILGQSRLVYEGMTDPVDNRRARWIIPPSCSANRLAGFPGFELKPGTGGGFTISAEITPGQCGLLDPDLFKLGGRHLGAPEKIRWVPVDGKEAVATWSCRAADGPGENSSVTPFYFSSFSGLQDHRAWGRLEFIFALSPNNLVNETINGLPAATEVIGRYLDGRVLRSPLSTRTPAEQEARKNLTASPDQPAEAAAEGPGGSGEDQAMVLKSGRHQPGLSPDLLKGWPNPFHDLISIRFTVPRTMKEAFIWKEKGEQPADISLEADVPWSGGMPGVSIKIYSINGQELVTLHSANLGAGQYTVQWNGTDAFGRKVASGTYFCKLQMDDWSVTRRLVFIR